MERNLNAQAQAANPFNEIFNCDKMKSLIADNASANFSERLSNLIKAYTKDAREKIWVDIESYRAN